MKVNCDIIRDLLPLYAEHLASDATNTLVEEHLAGCEACRAELEQMQKPVPVKPEETPAAPLKKIKGSILKKCLYAVLIAVAVVVCITAISARCYNALTLATVEEANIQLTTIMDGPMPTRNIVLNGDGVYLFQIDFNINKGTCTMQAVKYTYPKFHALLEPLVEAVLKPDPYDSKLWIGYGSTGSGLMSVECADDTLYYLDGKQVYRYAIPRSDGTVKYVYGTPDSIVGRRYAGD